MTDTINRQDAVAALEAVVHHLSGGIQYGDAIAAINALPAADEWQPIETMPLDTWVLAWGDPYSTDDAIYVVRKVMEPDWHHKGPHIQTNDGADIQATHWRPLPKPPIAALAD